MIHHIKINYKTKHNISQIPIILDDRFTHGVCVSDNKLMFTDTYILSIFKLDEPLPFTAVLPAKFFNKASKLSKHRIVDISIDDNLLICSFTDECTDITYSAKLLYYSESKILPLPFNQINPIIQNIKERAETFSSITFDAKKLLKLTKNINGDSVRTQIKIHFSNDEKIKPIFVESNNDDFGFGILMPVKDLTKRGVNGIINKIYGTDEPAD